MKEALINMVMLMGLDLLLIFVVSFIAIAIMESKKLKDLCVKWHQLLNDAWTHICCLTKTIGEDIKHNWAGIILLVGIIVGAAFLIFGIKNLNLSSLSISIMGTFIGVIIIFIILRPRLYIDRELKKLTIENTNYLKVRVRNLGIFPVNNVSVQLLLYRYADKERKDRRTLELQLRRPDTPLLRGICTNDPTTLYGCSTELPIADIQALKDEGNVKYEGILCRVKATHAISGVTYVREYDFNKEIVDKFLQKYSVIGRKSSNFRITALLGAGINLGLNLPFKPSTYNLTKEIVKAEYPIFDITNNTHRNSDLVATIYQIICENYSEEALDPKDSYNKVHFEILFHVLENLFSHSYVKEMKSKGKMLPDVYVPPFTYFEDLTVNYSISEIQQVMKQFITYLMDAVDQYNSFYIENKNNGANFPFCNFWATTSYKWDAFTLNYDTTLENSLPSYEDGFVAIDPKYDFKRFIPQRLLNSADNTVNHLHGCVNYGSEKLNKDDYNHQYAYLYNSEDYYLWSNYASVRRRWIGSSRSNITAQNHEVIFPSPIITGLNKTDKIISLPFNIYKHNLSRRLMTNNALLIAGYSFGDLYLNQEIERMRMYHGDRWRVVIIDYWDIDDEYEMCELDKLKNYLWAHNPHKDLVHLILKVAQENMLEGSIFVEKNKGQFVSKNGQLMLFVRGMNEALKFKDDIYDFLAS